MGTWCTSWLTSFSAPRPQSGNPVTWHLPEWEVQQFNYAQKEPHDLVAPHEFIKVVLELLNLSKWNVRQFNFAQKEPQDLVAPHGVIKVLPEQLNNTRLELIQHHRVPP